MKPRSHHHSLLTAQICSCWSIQMVDQSWLSWITMADRRAEKPMRCEYLLFLAFCVLGLACQVWLLASEFTRSSLPLITQDFEDRDVLPAITVCIPIKYSVYQLEWLNYLEGILESGTYRQTLDPNRVKAFMRKEAEKILKIYDVCKSRWKLEKSKNR